MKIFSESTQNKIKSESVYPIFSGCFEHRKIYLNWRIRLGFEYN
jgi:hypothetical protein